MGDRRPRAASRARREALLLLGTLVGILVFIVVGGTVVWAVFMSESACQERLGARAGGAEVSRAGWVWEPLGMRCVVRHADGTVGRFVVAPW